MEPKEKIYCKWCGKVLWEKSTDMFDEYTGEPHTKVKQCINPDCKGRCLNLGGHIFRAFAFWGPFGSCLRCGISYKDSLR